ncbi:MAG: Flp pilus assembly protein CpaB [Alphaproteobacteria bacterium]|nr:Flp pilus assembly protein CpaB [Alphaproteobacteria bacterium]
MSNRRMILLACAVLIAGITAFAVKSRIQPPPVVAEPAPVVKPLARVLVAKQNIPPGSIVKAGQDIGWEPWPAEALQPYYIKEEGSDINAYNGSVARIAIHPGEAVTTSALVKPGAGGFLSAMLEPGKRAVSIAVTPTSGNAGLIFPGDRVDLIVTHRMKLRSSPNAQEQDAVVSETFIENVRVVAVDQQLDNPENKAVLAKTISVEVTPEQAQRVAVAEDMGKISFTLRGLAAEPEKPKEEKADVYQDPFLGAAVSEPVEDAHYTRDTDVSPMLNQRSGVSPRITVIRGDTSEQHQFYQNGK